MHEIKIHEILTARLNKIQNASQKNPDSAECNSQDAQHHKNYQTWKGAEMHAPCPEGKIMFPVLKVTSKEFKRAINLCQRN